MDKQEKTSHPKPLSVKYRSHLENWIIQSSLLQLLVCTSPALCLSLSNHCVFLISYNDIKDMTCWDLETSEMIMNDHPELHL